MAINFNNQNRGIGALNLGDFGLQQPEENMTVAEAINFGTLPQAQEKFQPDFGGMLDATRSLGKSYKGTTKGDFIDAIEAGAFNAGTDQMFDRNVGDVFEGVNLGKKGMFSFGGVDPTLKGTTDGTFRNTLDIDKGALSQEALENLPEGFFKGVGDQSSLGLPTDDKYAMAISNYDNLFGPQTMTDAFGTTRSISGSPRPDINTDLMDAKTGQVLQNPFSPIGITDRGRSSAFANPEEMGAYEMIGGTPVAIGDVLGMQQALEKADFYEEPTNKGLGNIFGKLLGPAFTLAGFPTVGKSISAYNIGKSLQSGSLGKGVGALINKMKQRNVVQAQKRASAAQERQTQNLNNRLDYMLDRKAAGKSYSKKNLGEVQAAINEGINRREAAALADKTKSTDTGIRTDIDVADGGAESGGGGKIVCTMMNERYGFGFFRNKIWMKFHEGYSKDYIKGYHAIFLPLVKIAKGKGKINTAVRKVLEHMGRHVTADMFKIMKGKKRDTLGRIYRAIFEPACHIIGKIKSALGRG